MKKLFITLAGCFLLLGNVCAQNSAIESVQQETKAEKFLSESSFYQKLTVSTYSDNGIEIYGTVFIDLKTNKKVGALRFATESKQALAAFATAMSAVTGGNQTFDGSSKDLGYLDLENVESLVNALQTVVDYAGQKSQYKYMITYSAPGGISLHYNSDSNETYFGKAWNSVNEFGTPYVKYVWTEDISTKKLAKVIAAINDAKTKVQASL